MEKIIYNDDTEKEQILSEKSSKGKHLIEVQNHIVVDVNNDKKTEKALVFSDTATIEFKSTEQKISDIEERLTKLEVIK